MKANKFKFAIILILLQIILSLYFGLPLADEVKVPSHWNLQGEIDGWSSKWTAIFLFPGINIAILLLIIFFPAISPRYRKDPKRFEKIIPPIITILILFFAAIHIYSLLIARESVPETGNFILILIGLMFVFLGNLLPKIPANFYIGVRLPWTLSSEIVWRRTHRMAGWSFSIGGILMILVGFLGNITLIPQILLVLAFLLLVAFPIIYSFMIYKIEQKR